MAVEGYVVFMSVRMGKCGFKIQFLHATCAEGSSFHRF